MGALEESAIDVSFGNGEELLSAYWGYLTGGGLIIHDPGLEVGQDVSMLVTINSSASKYSLRGTVVKCEPDSEKAVIAFRPGQAHDMLLSEALAESDNVAPRRFARFSINCGIRVSHSGKELRATLVNLSQEGACLRLSTADKDELQLDQDATIVHGSVHALGKVVWVRHVERGLQMSADEAVPLLRLLCPELC